MTAEERFIDLEDEFREDPDYIAAKVTERVLRQICIVMDEQGVTQSELARRLGVSRQHICAFMSDPGNPTVRTLVEMAGALGLSAAIELKSETVHIRTDTGWHAEEFAWAPGTAVAPVRGGIPFDDIRAAA